MHGGVHISIHACTNDYLRRAKCVVHDRVHKNVIRCTKKRVSRFPILEALVELIDFGNSGNNAGMSDIF